MQPIVLLAIAVAGVAALSTGFLAPQINDVWLQNIGVGDDTLQVPLDHIKVDLDIEAKENFGEDLVDGGGDDFFENAFTNCSWHIAADDLSQAEMDLNAAVIADGGIPSGIEEVICKVLDDVGNAIAECGTEYAAEEFQFSTHYECENGLVMANPDSDDLDIDNVEDIRIVVRGTNPAWQSGAP